MRGTFPRLDELEVHVLDDAPVDAALLMIGDDDTAGEVLVLRRPQSFTHAVDRVAAIFPGEKLDDIRAVVRRHLGTADFDMTVLGAPPDWLRLPSEDPPRRPFWSSAVGRNVIGVVVGIVIAGGVGLGYAVSHRATARPSIFESATFKGITKAVNFECRAANDDDAICASPVYGVVTARGMQRTPAGSDWFAFYEGDDVTILRAFARKVDADEWARQPANMKLYGTIAHVGRYAVYGTSPQMLTLFTQAVTALPQGPPGGASGAFDEDEVEVPAVVF